ncbi:phd_YefM [bacterium BMS3Abin07]|nr:phd_YefM [bacterium BMS3Abin07]GBE32542.1 phd_YefM [bacterium BMS3Bbin05]HDO23594.1 type II toxin-antitoxin system prevent-host-death family antitoxin [Nitrospirota bacterium]HDZ87110.1 type II toxin-antitoxin system prevent-host-death family antitoxin [Nitrospirota bacterium]
MKFLTVRELKQKTSEIWKLVKEGEDLIITSNGKPVALLTGVSEDSLEDDLETLSRAKALKALEKIHRESLKKGTHRLSRKSIEKEISAVRLNRRRR